MLRFLLLFVGMASMLALALNMNRAAPRGLAARFRFVLANLAADTGDLNPAGSVLEQLRTQLKDKLDDRAARQADMDQVLEAPSAEARDLTVDEQTAFDEARTALTAIDGDIDTINTRVGDLEQLEERRRTAEEARGRFEGDGDRRENVRVGNEERVYRPDGDHSFFADSFRSTKGGDMRAQERLRRHAEQADYEARDVGTSAFGALVVPQYLVDEYAEVLRNGRSFANAVRREPLPAEGMVFNIPRGTTGTSTAAQATENSEVQETNFDETTLQVNVRTYAGQQDVSRQSLERGTPGIDRLVYADLVADYAETLDADLINGAGTSGTHLGVLKITGENVITYTDASPTVAEAWPKIADAIQQVATNRKLAANLVVVHPRRWAWFTASLDSSLRPLIVADPSQAVNAMGTAAAEAFGEGQLVGTLQGLPVLVNANVPTAEGGGTEDQIIIVRRQDPILWEEGDGMPRELRFEETLGGQLTVKLVVYGYSAFTAERQPTAVSRITGTGLIAPTF